MRAGFEDEVYQKDGITDIDIGITVGIGSLIRIGWRTSFEYEIYYINGIAYVNAIVAVGIAADKARGTIGGGQGYRNEG